MKSRIFKRNEIFIEAGEKTSLNKKIPDKLNKFKKSDINSISTDTKNLIGEGKTGNISDAIKPFFGAKLKLSLIVTTLSCFILVVLTSVYNNTNIPTNASLDMGMTILLDPGHGGIDSGCVGINGVLEKDINLSIAKNLSKLLRFSGFQVVMTRTEDISIYDEGITGIRNQKVSDMENRKKLVDTYQDGIFLSIHQNQFTEQQYFGAQMFYSSANKDNRRLAEIMQKNFNRLQPKNDREIKLIDNDLYLFKNTVQPAVLIECGFLSNEDDARKLSDSEYQKKVAFTIYKGLMEYIIESEETFEEEVESEIEDVLYMQ